MASINDHLRPDGSVDWKALEAADISDGKRCRECKAYIVFSSGGPQLCGNCTEMLSGKEATHHDLVRCPKCGTTWRPADNENYDLFEDGTHDVCCQHCDHDFEVRTRVSYAFTSPERIKEEESEE